MLHSEIGRNEKGDYMTIEEFYASIGGNYEEARNRLMNDTLIKRFLEKFLLDQSFSALTSALNAKNRELGFREAHTLKGVSANLALAPLTRSSSTLTEKLRGEGEFGDDINSLYLDVKRDYERIVELIKLLS